MSDRADAQRKLSAKDVPLASELVRFEVSNQPKLSKSGESHFY